MTEEELKSVPVLKEIESERNELLAICQELNATVIERIGEIWTSRDGKLYAEQLTEAFQMALKIVDYYDEIEGYWKSLPKEK